MTTTKTTQIRIAMTLDSTYTVQVCDRNGVWVPAESPAACGFASRDEADDYLQGWLNGSEPMEQVADVDLRP